MTVLKSTTNLERAGNRNIKIDIDESWSGDKIQRAHLNQLEVGFKLEPTSSWLTTQKHGCA